MVCRRRITSAPMIRGWRRNDGRACRRDGGCCSLGRLSRDKGLELLVEAWARAALPRDWQLVIAGPDYRGFEQRLRRRIGELGIEERVWLTGAVAGETKSALLASADVFVLPSYGEGFSVALLEAMAAGAPALYTTACHFPELADAGGGWMIDHRLELFVDALRSVAAASDSERKRRGEAGRTLGRSKFTIEIVAADMAKLYSSLTNSA